MNNNVCIILIFKIINLIAASAKNHNITTVIHLKNLVNNTNVIDIPVLVNNTNINNITLEESASAITNQNSSIDSGSVFQPGQPPIIQPPLVIQPPIYPPPVQPPIIQPPVLQPPVIHPPIFQPPVIQQPIIHQPIIHPPVIQPPVMSPPQIIQSAPQQQPCCQVISPRQCEPAKEFPFMKCYHLRRRQCGTFCSAPIVHEQPHQICDEVENSVPSCHQQVVYIPQPKPR